MIVTSYNPSVKVDRYPEMSALTADRQLQLTPEGGGGGRMMSMSPSPADILVNVHKDHLLDQNTLISYIYCFIKNFIGASGTNTVAIDNKIEQAMDLVKSHLMFAVREEVEVLKEKIAELMERISQLEYENTILRANATEQTLAQLKGPNANNPPNNSS